MTTGKNKEQFEKWYNAQDKTLEPLFFTTKKSDYDNYCFYELPFEMQIGVYLAFYDSIGYRVGMDCYYDMQGTYRADFVDKNNKVHGFQSKDMNTSYKEAFKKADELINQQQN